MSESPEYQREERSKQRKHTSASLRAGGSLVYVKKMLQKVERKEVRRRGGGVARASLDFACNSCQVRTRWKIANARW